MKNLLFTLLLFLFAFQFSSAQDFKMAAGARLGSPLGVDFKYFINENDAVDLAAGFSGLGIGSGIAFLAQYQRHADINFENIENFQWYFGAGATVGFWNYFGYNGRYFGAHGVIGLSYTFEDYPVNVSLDYAPGFYIGSGYSYYTRLRLGSYGALTGRYIFGG